MKPLRLVEALPDLEALSRELKETPFVAVDTESNSFHAYFEKICLIQISTAHQDYIIDPLSIKDMSPLGEVMAASNVQKIMHAASNDVSGFKRDFGFVIRNLFDTALAAKLLGYKKLGLAALLGEHFQVRLDKKCQRCDWAKRPLTRKQLDYARLDTHYLLALRHLLAERLEQEQLLDKAAEVFEKACGQEVQEKHFQPRGYLSIDGAHALDVEGKNILRSLYVYREHQARRLDKAPFRILSNAVLLKLARLRPTRKEDLRAVKGLPHHYRKSYSAGVLLNIIQKELDKTQACASCEAADSAAVATKRSKTKQ